MKVAEEFRVSQAGVCSLFYLSSPPFLVFLLQNTRSKDKDQDVLSAMNSSLEISSPELKLLCISIFIHFVFKS